jgi:dipeptidyl aminopeptidase/acylaminoacyl peptidase
VRYPEHPDRVLDGDLYLVNADGSGVVPLLDWQGWTAFSPDVSPDGRTVAFLAQDSEDVYYAPELLMAIDLPAEGAGGGPLTEGRRLAPGLDDEADDIRWADDGSAVYVTSRSRGSFPIYRVPLDGGAPEAIIAAPGSGRGVRSYDLAAGRLVYAATEVANPNELYTAADDGSGESRLTELNSGWLADREIVHPTEGWIERADETRGTRVQYWTMAPAGLEAGAKHPLVLAIHGGPSAMWGPGEHTMWHEFQLLAARGYGIVYANPRGSGGYGYDFKKANYQDWGAGPAGDLLAALDEAAKLPWVDPDKRFVVGGSYAGYMTAWIVGHDQRFDAAVAQRGVYDLSFFFGEGNAWRLVPYHMGGYPWEPEARAVLDRESPLTYVEEIRTPLLIIHSDRDRRTGVNQSEMLYKALKVLERPVEYVRYPEEGHDLSRSGDPKRRLDRLNRIVEFFERYR